MEQKEDKDEWMTFNPFEWIEFEKVPKIKNKRIKIHKKDLKAITNRPLPKIKLYAKNKVKTITIPEVKSLKKIRRENK